MLWLLNIILGIWWTGKNNHKIKYCFLERSQNGCFVSLLGTITTRFVTCILPKLDAFSCNGTGQRDLLPMGVVYNEKKSK